MAILFSVKWPVRQSDHSYQSSAKVKHGGSIPLILQHSSWLGMNKSSTSMTLIFIPFVYISKGS
jgi:hypothetical protein